MSSPNASDSEHQAAAKSADPTPTPALFGSTRAPKHNIHSVMNFEQLIKKVEQAEDALEASERAVAADWRQLQASWRAGWTPLRILVAGVASGFVFGRLEPGRMVARSGGGLLRMLSTVSGLIASVNAQLAASEAGHAAESAEHVADAAAGPSARASAPQHAEPPHR